MKLRQVTQTTLRDLKLKLKDKLQEVEVLKEMVRSANKQAKAKDIDIQRLLKRVQRLEKLTELGRGLGAAEHQATNVDETDASFASPPVRSDALGLNPMNYNQSVEDEV